MYYSKAWSDSMLGKPPYYQEADALITGLTVVKPYGEASPLTTLGIKDHASLQWIKTSAKGPITAWRNGLSLGQTMQQPLPAR